MTRRRGPEIVAFGARERGSWLGDVLAAVALAALFVIAAAIVGGLQARSGIRVQAPATFGAPVPGGQK